MVSRGRSASFAPYFRSIYRKKDKTWVKHIKDLLAANIIDTKAPPSIYLSFGSRENRKGKWCSGVQTYQEVCIAQ